MDKLFDMTDKVIIITGGAGMLGLQYATVLAEAGARIVLFDVLDSEAMANRIQSLDPEIHASVEGMTVDVSNERAVKKAVAAVYKKHGRIDVLINNAALTDFSDKFDRFSAYEDFPLPLWERELSVCLTGAFLCTRAVGAIMKETRRGVIVNVSSMYGIVGPDNRIYDKGKYRSIAYASAKSGILNFTRACASYFAPFGIRVNTFTPGGVYAGHDKKFFKAYSSRAMLGRMAKPEEYQGPILFLCSDASSYMTGANVVADGGWSAW